MHVTSGVEAAVRGVCALDNSSYDEQPLVVCNIMYFVLVQHHEEFNIVVVLCVCQSVAALAAAYPI